MLEIDLQVLIALSIERGASVRVNISAAGDQSIIIEPAGAGMAFGFGEAPNLREMTPEEGQMLAEALTAVAVRAKPPTPFRPKMVDPEPPPIAS